MNSATEISNPKRTRSEQSRINGAKSKGPVTIDGKAASSRNALKHGFAAKVNVLIAPDDSEAWHIHLAGYRDSYNPVNYQETEFVSQLASIAWRQSRLVGIETALIDFQLSIQEHNVDEHFPLEQGNPYFHLALAWQGLARKAWPRRLPADPNEPPDPTISPDGLDISSIELVRRYQVSLDRQFRNVLLNFRQYRKDFAPPSAPANGNLAGPLRNLGDLCADPSSPAPNEPKIESVDGNSAGPLRNLGDLCADPSSPAAPDSGMLLGW